MKKQFMYHARVGGMRGGTKLLADDIGDAMRQAIEWAKRLDGWPERGRRIKVIVREEGGGVEGAEIVTVGRVEVFAEREYDLGAERVRVVDGVAYHERERAVDQGEVRKLMSAWGCAKDKMDRAARALEACAGEDVVVIAERDYEFSSESITVSDNVTVHMRERWMGQAEARRLMLSMGCGQDEVDRAMRAIKAEADDVCPWPDCGPPVGAESDAVRDLRASGVFDDEDLDAMQAALDAGATIDDAFRPNWAKVLEASKRKDIRAAVDAVMEDLGRRPPTGEWGDAEWGRFRRDALSAAARVCPSVNEGVLWLCATLRRAVDAALASVLEGTPEGREPVAELVESAARTEGLGVERSVLLEAVKSELRDRARLALDLEGQWAAPAVEPADGDQG